jgi:hypothetical protein
MADNYIVINDSATGIDSISIAKLFNTMTINDAGYGLDLLSIISKIYISDSGSGTDNDPTIFAEVSVSDSGVGTESISIEAFLSILDRGYGRDIFSIFVEIPELSDSGVGVDSIIKGIILTDEGTGVDSISSIFVTLSVSDSGKLEELPVGIKAFVEVLDDAISHDDISIRKFKSVIDFMGLIPDRVVYDHLNSDIFNNLVAVFQDHFSFIARLIEAFDFYDITNPDIVKVLMDSLGFGYRQKLTFEENVEILKRLVSWYKERITARGIQSIVRANRLPSDPVIYEPFTDVMRLSKKKNVLSGKKYFADSDYYRPSTYDIYLKDMDAYIQEITSEIIPAGIKGYRNLMLFDTIVGLTEADLYYNDSFNVLITEDLSWWYLEYAQMPRTIWNLAIDQDVSNMLDGWHYMYLAYIQWFSHLEVITIQLPTVDTTVPYLKCGEDIVISRMGNLYVGNNIPYGIGIAEQLKITIIRTSMDSYIFMVVTETVSMDAFVQHKYYLSESLDALVNKSNNTISTNLNAYIQQHVTKYTNLDAIITR